MYTYTSSSGEWVKVPYQPTATDRCVSCNHLFGDHFETFSSRKSGCAHIEPPKNKMQCRCINSCGHKQTKPCVCEGFAFRYRESWQWRQTKVTPWYSGDWNIKYGSGNTVDNMGNRWTAEMAGNTFRGNDVTVTTTSMNTDPVPFKDGEIIKYKRNAA
jgi:hypothetical protein